MLVVTEPEPRRNILLYYFWLRLPWMLWLAIVHKRSSDWSHSYREADFGILNQLRFDSQPAKMSKSSWEIKD